MQTANRSTRNTWRCALSVSLSWSLCVACTGVDTTDPKHDAVTAVAEALTTTQTASFQDGANQYAGTSDNEIVQRSPTTNNANAQVLYVSGDEPRWTGRDVSALLRFDVSSIPNDAVVTEATLTLYVVDPSANQFPIYGLSRVWSENGSSWLRAAAGNPWQSLGASGTLDRDSMSAGFLVANSIGSATVTLNAVGRAVVQSWVEDPMRNFGLILAQSAAVDRLGFASSEYGTVGRRPRLVVTYTRSTPDCIAPACCTNDSNCDDANPCTTDACVSGACSHAATANCCNSANDCPDDQNPCTSNTCEDHRCDVQAIRGCCLSDSACNDDNACTVDTCDANACFHAAIGGCCLSDAECNDGNVCTAEVCVSNACASAPVPGCCLSDAECNDGNACTAEACVGNACASAPVPGCCLSDAECNDGNACTAEACVGNACASVPVPGCCLSDAECNDGNACTADSCINAACAHQQLTGGSCGCTVSADCDDGDPCSLDTCVDAQCSNRVANCSDDNPTTADLCVDGYCHHTGPVATTRMFRNGQDAYLGATDTRIAQYNPASNYDSDPTLMADGDEPSGGNNDVFALLQWKDLGIPTHATVTAASITLNIGGDSNAASASAYPVYAMRRPWTASQATWQQADSTHAWSTNGLLGETDRGTDPIGSTPISTAGNATLPLNAAGVNAVQSWVNDPTQNYGIVVASTSNTDGLVFYSSEFTNAWYRPMLSVTYTTEQTLVDPEPVGTGGTPNVAPKYGFFVYSDSHVEAATNPGFQAALEQMTAIKNADGAPPVIAAISLGDHTEDGKPASWDYHLKLTEAYWDADTPSFGGALPRYVAVPGNHDVMDSKTWYTSWTTYLPGLLSLGGTSSSAAGVYYQFNLQNALFVGLDTNTAVNSATAYNSDPQIQLLRTALADSSAAFKFVFYHKPAFYCGNGGLGPNAASVAFVDLAAQNNVDVVFNGHSHVYSRTCRMTKDHVCTGTASGTVQLEVGTVGATDARERALKTTAMSVTGYDASGVKSTLNYTCNGAGGYAATLGSQRTFCFVNVKGCRATVSCYQVGTPVAFDVWDIDHCR